MKRKQRQAGAKVPAVPALVPVPVDVPVVPDVPGVPVRLDVYLTRLFPDLSRAQAQRLISAGHVRIEPEKAVRASLAVQPAWHVHVTRPAAVPAEPAAEPIPLSIVYDDADLVVVNKPAGLVVHPAAGHRTGTLVNALLHHVRGLSGIGGVERPGIVHRLDRGTSGLMVVAKHDRAHRELTRQFQDRSVQKEYLALAWGAVKTGARFEAAIGRDRRQRHRMSTRAARARPALTTVLEAEALRGVTLVRLAIHTGRTHQIRVHLADAGHAVVGDDVYGGVRRRLPAHLAPVAALERPFLHAARLAFAHPADGRPLAFDAPLPADLDEVIAALRRVATSSRHAS